VLNYLGITPWRRVRSGCLDPRILDLGTSWEYYKYHTEHARALCGGHIILRSTQALRLCEVLLVSCFTLASYLISYFSTLKVETIYFSETSVHFHRTTWRCIPEYRTLHRHRCKNLISKLCKLMFYFRDPVIFHSTQMLSETELIVCYVTMFCSLQLIFYLFLSLVSGSYLQ
jgi:hypothetical protein